MLRATRAVSGVIMCRVIAYQLQDYLRRTFPDSRQQWLPRVLSTNNSSTGAKPSCCGWPWGLDYCQERWTLCTRKELRVDLVRSRIERIQKGARARVFIIILVKVYPEGCNYLLFYVKVSILENLHELQNFVIRVHTLLWMKFSWQGGHVCSCCQKK